MYLVYLLHSQSILLLYPFLCCSFFPLLNPLSAPSHIPTLTLTYINIKSFFYFFFFFSFSQNYINAAGFARRLLELPDMNSERNAESRSKVIMSLTLSLHLSRLVVNIQIYVYFFDATELRYFKLLLLTTSSFLSFLCRCLTFTFHCIPLPPTLYLTSHHFTSLLIATSSLSFFYQAQKVLQKSEQQGRNEFTIDYDEMNPFRSVTNSPNPFFLQIFRMLLLNIFLF